MRSTYKQTADTPKPYNKYKGRKEEMHAMIAEAVSKQMTASTKKAGKKRKSETDETHKFEALTIQSSSSEESSDE